MSSTLPQPRASHREKRGKTKSGLCQIRSVHAGGKGWRTEQEARPCLAWPHTRAHTSSRVRLSKRWPTYHFLSCTAWAAGRALRTGTHAEAATPRTRLRAKKPFPRQNERRNYGAGERGNRAEARCKNCTTVQMQTAAVIVQVCARTHTHVHGTTTHGLSSCFSPCWVQRSKN